MPEPDVRHNVAASRFEIATADGLAQAVYRRSDAVVTFLHTEVPEEQQGGGVGGRLARAALDWARAEGASVTPLCPFFAAYIRRHPTYRDLVTPGFPL